MSSMPTGGLYKAVNAIRIEAILEAERSRLSTLSGKLSVLRDRLPPCQISREQAVRLREEYEIRKQAQQIVEALMPRRI